MKTIEKKEYDCVDSVRQIRNQMAKDLDGKSTEEILAYFSDSRKKFQTRLNAKVKK